MTHFRFPLGIAKDPYFCNRVEETHLLIKNIKSNTHSVLISPRRYGKTSLAYRAIENCGLIYSKVDLYMSTSHTDIERTIINGVNNIIRQLEGITEKLFASLKNYVKSLKPVLALDPDGMKFSLEPNTTSNPTDNICEALQILDQILQQKNKRCVLLIDEFQEVERVAKNQGIEGAIRHVAQETQHFVLIFSGSKRHLLKSMFNDRNKPLYRLCDEIALARINHQDYYSFINRFAKQKWGKILAKPILEQVMLLTEQHLGLAIRPGPS